MDSNYNRRRRRDLIYLGSAAFLLISNFFYWASPVFSQTPEKPILYYSVITIESERDLPVLARRYNTTVEEIISQNPQYKELKPGITVTIKENKQVNNKSRGLTGSWYWPLNGEVTSLFGQRDHDYHHGLDIAVPSGSQVRAARAGRVEKAESIGVYGLTVLIDHGNGVQSLYAHNSRLLVKVGQRVESGQVISLSGNTGKTTGPHLHFEIRLDRKALDPLNYLP